MPIIAPSPGSSSGSSGKTATTVAGLGSPVDGMVGEIRLAASPYTLVTLTYDATYAHWVSDPQLLMLDSSGATGIAGNTNGAYADIASTFLVSRQAHIANILSANTAGLTPQFRVSAWLNTGAGGGTIKLRVAVGYANNGDASAAWSLAQWVTGDLCSVSTSTDTFEMSDFAGVTGTAPTTQEHGIVRPQLFNSTSAGLVRALQIWFRWVG